MKKFDVIVVGGGHAGLEAACAAARAGSETLLITLKKNKIGHMPCNPAVGGIGKGHIVYEISAFDGVMPKLCSKSYLQARMLNTKKGPAVQGLRLQIDKHLYATEAQKLVLNTKNLTVLEDRVERLLYNDITKTVYGVTTAISGDLHAASVVITTGTFLHGLIHIGTFNKPSGRSGEEAVFGLSDSLRSLGLRMSRLKTGTPPRLQKTSLDFSKMEEQIDEPLNYLFEFDEIEVKQKVPCFMTHTNSNTHTIIRNNVHLSAMYNGNIKGIGPRYCPSIEDKIGKFASKESHHVFVEPESLSPLSEFYNEIYPNGLSTSLPESVQLEYIRSIKGFENAIITRPGYAVEYDFVHPNQLKHSLELKDIHGLFLAGQINGTTGYEEAAGQGLLAGINAHLRATNQAALVLDRSESYIGVMIDDLVSMGIDEPYRMFTSRAERRLILRQDNVFLRLTDLGYALGFVSEALYQKFCKEKKVIHEALAMLEKKHNSAFLTAHFGTDEENLVALKERLLEESSLDHSALSKRALLVIHAEIRYGPYIIREHAEVKKREQYKQLKIPIDFIYEGLSGLSKELQQKLKKNMPTTIANAALIQGMTPAALTLLIFKINFDNRKK